MKVSLFRCVWASAAVVITLGAASTRVLAEPAAAGSGDAPAVGLDVEIDPIAYAAAGYSLHVGLSWNRYRLDLGAFAAELPAWVHGNDGFAVAFGGFGTKLDVFWRADRSGPFAGVEAGLLEARVVDEATGMLDAGRRLQAGARIGWRISLPARFYVTPWVGVGYAFGAGDRMIAGRAFEESPLVVFPTVHLGRVFE